MVSMMLFWYINMCSLNLYYNLITFLISFSSTGFYYVIGPRNYFSPKLSHKTVKQLSVKFMPLNIWFLSSFLPSSFLSFLPSFPRREGIFLIFFSLFFCIKFLVSWILCFLLSWSVSLSRWSTSSRICFTKATYEIKCLEIFHAENILILPLH